MSPNKEIREKMQTIVEEMIGEQLNRVPRKQAWFQTDQKRNFLLSTSTEDYRGIIWIGIPPELLISEENSNNGGKILIAVTPYRETSGEFRLYESDLEPFVRSWIDAGRPTEASKCHAYLEVKLGKLSSTYNAKFGGIQMHRLQTN